MIIIMFSLVLGFSFPGIGHDLVSMIHGTIQYGPQALSIILQYRQAIIEINRSTYPEKLLRLTNGFLQRKASQPQTDTNQTVRRSSASSYTEEFQYRNMLLERNFIFYDGIIVHDVKYRTISSIRSKKYSDCCVSFLFGRQIKIGFVRGIVRDATQSEDVFVLLEELANDETRCPTHFLQVKRTQNDRFPVPFIHVRARSSCLFVPRPGDLIKKHAYRILSNEETVEIIEYASLCDSS
jgi:hypothetical protein